MRWCDRDGNVVLTGDERASQAEQRASQSEKRAQQLAERLRVMGIDPDIL
ncbi:hypothetical protein NUACC21_77810 [Scytonema sp. NUACC21]